MNRILKLSSSENYLNLKQTINENLEYYTFIVINLTRSILELKNRKKNIDFKIIKIVQESVMNLLKFECQIVCSMHLSILNYYI